MWRYKVSKCLTRSSDRDIAYEETVTAFTNLPPPRSEDHRDGDEEDPPSAENTEVAPQMSMTKRHAREVVVTRDTGSSKACSANTCARLSTFA
jgi:hypothetical protein